MATKSKKIEPKTASCGLNPPSKKTFDNWQEMVEKIDQSKKINPKDLSSDQDLSIAVMNLISLEEHFMFSGAKTKKTQYYDMINDIREMRKELMQKLIPGYEGEVWCISKHLLATSMRIMEVGTKALGNGDNKTAYDLFEKSYDLYSLFWGLNMGLIDATGAKQIDSQIIADYNSKQTKSTSANHGQTTSTSIKNEPRHNKGILGSMGDWVKNAVNCCIE